MEEDGNSLNTPQSAFLGPTLWDKTLPYDGDNFQLEYMDLEEFLLENNIPANSQSEQNQPSQQPLPPQPPSTPPTPSVVDLSNRAVHSGIGGQNCLQSPSRAGTVPITHTTNSLTPLFTYTLKHRGSKRVCSQPCHRRTTFGSPMNLSVNSSTLKNLLWNAEVPWMTVKNLYL